MNPVVFCGVIFTVLWIEAQSAALHYVLLPLDFQQEECIKELKLDRETMAYLSTQEFHPEDNPDFDEFFSCTWKKQKYQHKDGLLNYRALQAMLYDTLKEQAGSNRSARKIAKEMAYVAVNDCSNVRGSSHGQTAVKTQNCMYRRLLQLAYEYRHLNRSETEKAA